MIRSLASMRWGRCTSLFPEWSILIIRYGRIWAPLEIWRWWCCKRRSAGPTTRKAFPFLAFWFFGANGSIDVEVGRGTAITIAAFADSRVEGMRRNFLAVSVEDADEWSEGVGEVVREEVEVEDDTLRTWVHRLNGMRILWDCEMTSYALFVRYIRIVHEMVILG